MFWGLLKNSRKPHFIFQDFIARAIISVSEDIEEYQAIQYTYTDITINVQLRKESEKHYIKKKIVERLRKVFFDYNCVEPKIKVIFCDALLNKNFNKLNRIKCNIGEKNA